MADPLDAAIEGVRRIEAGARRAGKEVADYLIGRFPLPLPDAVRGDAIYTMARDMAECFEKENRPETFPGEFVVLMQFAAFDAFDARLRQIVEASGQEGGRS